MGEGRLGSEQDDDTSSDLVDGRLSAIMPRKLFQDDAAVKSGLLQVFVRMKPLPESTDTCLLLDQNHMLKANWRNTEAVYKFSQVFQQHADQSAVYEGTTASLVDDFLDFRQPSAVVMAYGVTSAGKTFTMQGTPDKPGLVPLALRDIFQAINSGSDSQHRVSLSVCEIYNESIHDLLAPVQHIRGKQALRLKEDKQGHIQVVGMSEVPVHSAKEALELLKRAGKARQSAGTGVNEHSSRSHAVITVTLQAPATAAALQGDAGDTCSTAAFRRSSLHFVDLAGCERVKRTGNSGARLRESVAINSSLMTLARCLEVLRYNQQHPGDQKVIPYRESKITHLFKEVLHGNGRFVMLVNVSPACEAFNETKRVLQYAALASKVTMTSEVEHEMTGAPWPAQGNLAPDASTSATANAAATADANAAAAAAAALSAAQARIEELLDDKADLEYEIDVVERKVELLREELIRCEVEKEQLEAEVRAEVQTEMQTLLEEATAKEKAKADKARQEAALAKEEAAEWKHKALQMQQQLEQLQAQQQEQHNIEQQHVQELRSAVEQGKRNTVPVAKHNKLLQDAQEAATAAVMREAEAQHIAQTAILLNGHQKQLELLQQQIAAAQAEAAAVRQQQESTSAAAQESVARAQQRIAVLHAVAADAVQLLEQSLNQSEGPNDEQQIEHLTQQLLAAAAVQQQQAKAVSAAVIGQHEQAVPAQEEAQGINASTVQQQLPIMQQEQGRDDVQQLEQASAVALDLKQQERFAQQVQAGDKHNLAALRTCVGAAAQHLAEQTVTQQTPYTQDLEVLVQQLQAAAAQIQQQLLQCQQQHSGKQLQQQQVLVGTTAPSTGTAAAAAVHSAAHTVDGAAATRAKNYGTEHINNQPEQAAQASLHQEMHAQQGCQQRHGQATAAPWQQQPDTTAAVVSAEQPDAATRHGRRASLASASSDDARGEPQNAVVAITALRCGRRASLAAYSSAALLEGQHVQKQQRKLSGDATKTAANQAAAPAGKRRRRTMAAATAEAMALNESKQDNPLASTQQQRCKSSRRSMAALQPAAVAAAPNPAIAAAAAAEGALPSLHSIAEMEDNQQELHEAAIDEFSPAAAAAAVMPKHTEDAAAAAGTAAARAVKEKCSVAAAVTAPAPTRKRRRGCSREQQATAAAAAVQGSHQHVGLPQQQQPPAEQEVPAPCSEERALRHKKQRGHTEAELQQPLQEANPAPGPVNATSEGSNECREQQQVLAEGFIYIAGVAGKSRARSGNSRTTKGPAARQRRQAPTKQMRKDKEERQQLRKSPAADGTAETNEAAAAVSKPSRQRSKASGLTLSQVQEEAAWQSADTVLADATAQQLRPAAARRATMDAVPCGKTVNNGIISATSRPKAGRSNKARSTAAVLQQVKEDECWQPAERVLVDVTQQQLGSAVGRRATIGMMPSEKAATAMQTSTSAAAVSKQTGGRGSKARSKHTALCEIQENEAWQPAEHVLVDVTKQQLGTAVGRRATIAAVPTGKAAAATAAATGGKRAARASQARSAATVPEAVKWQPAEHVLADVTKQQLGSTAGRRATIATVQSGRAAEPVAADDGQHVVGSVTPVAFRTRHRHGR